MLYSDLMGFLKYESLIAEFVIQSIDEYIDIPMINNDQVMKILLTIVKHLLLHCLWTTLHCGGRFASNSQINIYRKNIKNIFE